MSLKGVKVSKDHPGHLPSALHSTLTFNREGSPRDRGHVRLSQDSGPLMEKGLGCQRVRCIKNAKHLIRGEEFQNAHFCDLK